MEHALLEGSCKLVIRDEILKYGIGFSLALSLQAFEPWLGLVSSLTSSINRKPRTA